MNDALDHGARMRSETVTMSRDEYEVAIRAAKVDALREAAQVAYAYSGSEYDVQRHIASILDERADDELEGEG